MPSTYYRIYMAKWGPEKTAAEHDEEFDRAHDEQGSENDAPDGLH